MPNKTLRATHLKARRALSLSMREHYAEQICQSIMQLDVYNQSNHIALYRAMPDEVSLDMLWLAALKAGKQCYFPVLAADKSLQFLPTVADTPFHKNKFQIEEPAVEFKQAIDLSRLDLVVVPLVAFDESCNRLGMGMGCYDRTLPRCTHAVSVGVAFSCQQATKIITASWDVPLDAVVTEQAIFWRDKK